jgi:hypothetical protein
LLAIAAKHAFLVLVALYAAVAHITFVKGVFAVCALHFFAHSELEQFLAAART